MIRTIDSHQISYEEKKLGKRAVLLCHGITSSKDEGGFYVEMSRILNSQALSTLRFDFRGHGDSFIPSSSATIAGMICDLHKVYMYMAENYSNVSVVAASFGASILLLLMQKFKMVSLNRLVLLNPVTNFGHTFTEVNTEWSKSFFPNGGIDGVLRSRTMIRIGTKHTMSPLMAIELFYYEPEKTAYDISVPTLIVHGRKDNIVPIEDSRAFSENNTTGLISLKEYEASSHGLEEDREEVIEQISHFLRNGDLE